MANVRINQQFVKGVEKTVRDRLDKYCAFLVNHIKKKLSAGRRGSIGSPGIRDGDPPHVDSGELRNSIFKMWKEGDPNSILVGSSAVYSWLQEMGGTVHPKVGKYLAIPLSKEAKAWQARGNGARSFQLAYNTTVITSHRGAKLVVEKKRNKFIIHYLLTTSATISPHPFLRPSLNETQGDFARIMAGG